MLLEEERSINSSRRNTYVDGRQDTVRLVSRDNEIEVDSKHLVRYTTVISGCLVSSIICIVSIIYLFGIQVIPLYAIITALILALFLSILGIRALGETDLNPVSGIGKISQLIFQLSPGNTQFMKCLDDWLCYFRKITEGITIISSASLTPWAISGDCSINDGWTPTDSAAKPYSALL